MPESISFSSSSAALDPERLMSVAPEEPNQCAAPPPSPAVEAETPPAASAGQKLVVEYDRRGPSCARERMDALRDCSFAALGVVTSLAASRSLLSLASVGPLARDVLRCTESLVRLDDCREVAEAKQAAEQRCEARGGQVIRGEQQVLCFEPRQ